MKLPRFTASTPAQGTGLVRANDIGALTRTDGGAMWNSVSQVGNAVSGTGGLAFKVYQERKKLDQDLAWGTATTKTEEHSREALEAATLTNFSIDEKPIDDPGYLSQGAVLDYEKNKENTAEMMREWDEKQAKIRESFKTEGEKKRFDVWSDKKRLEFLGVADGINRTKYNEFQEDKLSNLAKNAYRNGDIEIGDHYVSLMQKSKLISPKIATKKREEGRQISKKVSIENIKPLLVDAVNKEGKGLGYNILDSSVNSLVEDGTLTKAEGADANKILGDWLDNYVSGRIQSDKAVAKLTTRQTYQELMPALLDDTKAESRYDMVEQSKLSPDDKKKFNHYIKGSYKDAPTVNTPAGHTDSTGIVFDAMTLELSPQEAYDELLELRFGKKPSITNKQFEWAINKIENPYPKPVAEALRGALNNNLSVGWFDDETDKKVNENLVAFVDDLVERDKVPDFDLDKKLYAMSQKYRYGMNSGFQIGNVIDIDGNNWEVVGFDKNGEPLMEPIE